MAPDTPQGFGAGADLSCTGAAWAGAQHVVSACQSPGQYQCDGGPSMLAPAGPQAAQTARPATVACNFQDIPPDLQALPQWVTWRYQARDGGLSKVPFHPPTNRFASTTNPATWSTFAEAVRFAPYYDGIGLVLVQANGLVIIDLDDKPDNPASAEELQFFTEIIANFATYTELSVGGRGCHIVCGGVLPAGGKGRRQGHLEIYAAERYLTFTGNTDLSGLSFVPPALQTIWQIKNCQGALNQLLARLGSTGHSGDLSSLIELPATKPDGLVWEALRKHQKHLRIIALCEGKWKETGHPSASEADLALLSYIANSSMSNEQVRRMFRQTVLGQRPKHVKGNYHIDRALQIIRGRQISERSATLAANAQMNAMLDAMAVKRQSKEETQRLQKEALQRQMERFVSNFPHA